MTDRARSPVLPSPGVQPGGRRYVHDLVELVVNGDSGLYDQVTTAPFRVSLPSARLHTKVVCSYLPFGGESTPFPQSGAGAWTVTLEEWNRTNKGLYLQGTQIFTTPQPVPFSYEAVTISDQWRGAVTVPALGTGIPPGVLYLWAAWEPAAGDNIADDELQKLFAACSVQGAAIQTFQFSGG
jgi:hypothetical protein